MAQSHKQNILLNKILYWAHNLAPIFYGALGPVWPDWAIYWTLGNFLKPLATINLPKSPSVKVSKSFIFLVKSFLVNFYGLLRFFLVTLPMADISMYS